MDYSGFVAGANTLLVAPAGYGKTYTIVEGLKHSEGHQLVLTHTHAGVASIKSKIKNAKISSDKCSVETLSSFAQKYVEAFYMDGNIPDQDNSKEYHPFIIKTATSIFRSTIGKQVLKATYDGLFVDEYQDCTRKQHRMVMSISNSLKTHILGDPLQGIFDFDGELVDFDNDLADFNRFPDLTTPHRWYSGDNNPALGDKLKDVRHDLERGLPVDLSKDKIQGLYLFRVNPDDIRDPRSYYRRCLSKIIQNQKNNPDLESLLLIVPEFEEKQAGDQVRLRGNIRDRAKLRALIDYSKSLWLIEAIDDKSFYSLSKVIDILNLEIGSSRNPVRKIQVELLQKLFNKTELSKWFNANGIKNKRDKASKKLATRLSLLFDQYLEQPTPKGMEGIILFLKDQLNFKYLRPGLLYSLLNSLKTADQDNCSVLNAMKSQRNMIRRSGQKISGKCIGTTLLTKGLEFDSVVILDADKFDSPKHFYVAITRCCKNLFIFSKDSTFEPYK